MIAIFLAVIFEWQVFHILDQLAILIPEFELEKYVSDTKHDGHLGAVYGASGQGDVKNLYDSWAKTYDAEMATAGYRHPTICLALLARYLPRGAGPLLDAGVGTGLIGEWLGIMGYEHVEGLDISTGMLAEAAKKNTYKALHQLALGSDLPFDDGSFAGVVSTGVFTTGHVGTEGLGELIRICRAGGVIVLSVKDALWQAEFGEHVAGLEAEGVISCLEDTGPYISMPGEEGISPSRSVVFRVA